MKISKEQKEAIEYLEKYTKWETYGERNLEKDIITVLELLKETQRKLEIVNDYNYWVLLAADRGIELKKLQNENEKLKTKLLDTLEGQKVIKEETLQYIKENYISKEKVKNMIKEKEWALENYDCDKSDYKHSQAIGAWDILQKLLKESEE